MITSANIIKPSSMESPLYILLVIVAIILWILICVSLIGIIYGLFLGVIFLFVQAKFIAHLRGSSIKLGPNQIPELYNRVVELSQVVGLDKVPDTYIMESHGAINAFATRFFNSNFIVLYSDMIEACEGNPDALNFIIAHELGHVKRKHIQKGFWIAPALFVPILSHAYYQACEYTCDRYGHGACLDKDKALDGLIILAAGPKNAKLVNRQAFADQRQDLETIWMKIGSWFSSHPPISKRIVALDKNLIGHIDGNFFATFIAFLVTLIFVAAPLAAFGFFGHSLYNDVQKLKTAVATKNTAPAAQVPQVMQPNTEPVLPNNPMQFR